jgi:nitrogen fixation protein FixH
MSSSPFSENKPHSSARWSDKLIPWYFVLFFLVLAIVDGFLVYLATSTQTGIVTENAYEKGLNYNQTLAEGEKEKELGWSTSLAFLPSETGHEGQIIYQVKGEKEIFLKGAEVSATLYRPVQAGYDFAATLTEKQSSSHKGGALSSTYSAQVKFPLPGVWLVKVKTVWKGHTHHSFQRIRVP